MWSLLLVVVDCSVGCCLMFVEGCLCVVWQVLFVGCRLMHAVRCALCVLSCLLYVVCDVLRVACRVLFACRW